MPEINGPIARFTPPAVGAVAAQPTVIKVNGWVDTGPPRAEENLIITPFPSVDDAVVVAREKSSGANPAVAVVAAAEGVFELRQVTADAASDSWRETPLHLEGSAATAPITFTETAARAIVDGEVVIRNEG